MKFIDRLFGLNVRKERYDNREIDILATQDNSVLLRVQKNEGSAILVSLLFQLRWWPYSYSDTDAFCIRNKGTMSFATFLDNR